jgi:hypothetical protein
VQRATAIHCWWCSGASSIEAEITGNKDIKTEDL